MPGGDLPHTLTLARFAPAKGTAGAHQPFEDLRVVPRVQHDQPHAGDHPLLHAGDQRILHRIVRGVAPPQQHIGSVQHLRRQSLIRLIQSGRAHREVGVLAQHVRQHLMQTLRVDLRDRRILPLVDILVPDGDAKRMGHAT